jgi:hypothetical protein
MQVASLKEDDWYELPLEIPELDFRSMSSKKSPVPLQKIDLKYRY